MADLKISQLTALPAIEIDATDQLPLADVSAATTKKATPLDLFAAGVRLTPAGGIPGAKVDFSGGVALPAGAVGTAALADGGVTTIKVADGAITNAKITGPIGLDKLGTATAGAVLAGPTTGGAAAPTFRRLDGADLPLATTAAVGGIKIGSTGGLTVASDGTASLTAVAVAGTNPVVTYNTFGQVTAGRALTGADLPVATSSAVGGVKPGSGLSVATDGTLSAALAAANLPVATSSAVGGVKPGAGLSVDVAGSLAIDNSVTAGTGAKVTFNAQGLITGTAALAAADIPDLDASKIVSGTLPGVHIADRSITQQKLADHAISYIQEAAPSSISGDHPIGELWFQESSARLSMWNGNSWMAVGQGSLSNENLRFCGTFNAATGLVTAVTQFGTTAGLTPAAAVPPAANALTGAYLVCDTAGTFSGATYDPGDWVLCLGQARGWDRIDTLSGGGGGGGGSSTLGALTDVTVTTPSDGDVLRYNGTRWVNTMANLDPGSY
jgi:hypothetical protein